MAEQDATSKLIRGTVDLIVLRALEHERMHGFAIAAWIRERGSEVVGFEDAALYQSLHRLERRGLVRSDWGRSENNRRARFYELTPNGRARLTEDVGAFRAYADAMKRLLHGVT